MTARVEPRQVSAAQGWSWIVGGFNLFRKNPLTWILLCLILVAIAMAMALIPVIGQLAFYLLSPVFLAGLMLGCQALAQQKHIEIAHLFAGFQKNTNALITVGGAYLIGQVVIFGVVLAFGGSAVAQAFLGGGGEFDRSLLAGSQVMFAMLVGLALSVPLMMAIWFAPMLVVFHDLPAVAAMRLSFFACLQNILPFLVYGVMILMLALIAAIPLGLGFLVLAPTIFGSIYESYKDLFLVRN